MWHRLFWRRRRPFRGGAAVRVRPLTEILATLDGQGRLEGMPFMPEMAEYCGKTFHIARRMDQVFLDHHLYTGRLTGLVRLEGLRCDGRFHHGCQMGCNLLWKEAWLEPLETESAARRRGAQDAGDAPAGWFAGASQSPAQPKGARLPAASAGPSADWIGGLPTEVEGRFFCQATELAAVARRLPWWDVGQYLRRLSGGELSPGQLVRMVALIGWNRLRRRLGLHEHGMVRGPGRAEAAAGLHLQPGELLEVKALTDIAATLDGHGRMRGLAFVPEMARHCGRRFRVARRVDRLIVEWSGQMRELCDTVALEGVICHGLAQRRCPRGCFHLWREAWLRRVESPPSPGEKQER
jgi:hypothetical protein